MITSLNTTSIAITTCLVFITVLIVTYPYDHPPFPVFWMDPLELHQNDFLNHFTNILVLIFDLGTLEEKVVFYPIGSLGVIILAIGKLFFVVIIINFLYKKLEDKINEI